MERIDHMKYLPDMEVLENSDIMDKVISAKNNYDYDKYTAVDVRNALSHDTITVEDFKALLSPAALDFIEEIAQRAQKETRKHFGNSICMFTPLYIANYCENYCIYCGFNSHNKIKRAKLTLEEIDKEMAAISKTGLEEILLLTGESRNMSDVEYIGEACKIAKKYFKLIGIEVYPMNSDEYRYLHECGADFVTVFQETYNSDKYETLHLEGHKRIFPYRFNAQERAILGGMRGVGFAALLGLDDFRKDAFATGMHAYLLQRKYPHADIAFSCPRLCPIINNDKINPKDVHEKQLVQVICAYRLFMPFASITVSTREKARFRNNIIKIAATKISAGVNTGIGEHADGIKDHGDVQFEISDPRSVDEVASAIKEDGLQPVMNDYVYV
ncbi:MAG: 2-iminoacetate synthase ThiH [Inconstantimicrobium porci]|uniref:2-iminoacetate synthase ThiH n=1 Tax=Inconstantimicrobium porci TaxID=2652291 RepID=A0A7X2T1B9_9CLOT|nr:2-iminoacetate synthase ThiH [Inconstantimicrobium porci]MDD6771017.1 2-iminoacetate synthase ThiH [Inconstantimicrobium porci]MDY5911296.1 2-iminoacetate synthase ThiH [Inconstantimicrobium porci]MSR90723.1 2-iminoacetate synthase ThiH [Inconstantimicrobium porci]